MRLLSRGDRKRGASKNCSQPSPSSASRLLSFSFSSHLILSIHITRIRPMLDGGENKLSAVRPDFDQAADGPWAVASSHFCPPPRPVPKVIGRTKETKEMAMEKTKKRQKSNPPPDSLLLSCRSYERGCAEEQRLFLTLPRQALLPFLSALTLCVSSLAGAGTASPHPWWRGSPVPPDCTQEVPYF